MYPCRADYALGPCWLHLKLVDFPVDGKWVIEVIQRRNHPPRIVPAVPEFAQGVDLLPGSTATGHYHVVRPVGQAGSDADGIFGELNGASTGSELFI